VKSIKHTVQCHCILPQYRNKKDPVFHKFVVFGALDNSDTLLAKYVKCNHCSAVHRIYDVCKSEIVIGKEDSSAITTIEDLRLMVPPDIVSVLDSYNCELHVFEHVFHILKHKLYEEHVILTKEVMDEEVIGKRLVFSKEGMPTITSFMEEFSENF